jgi:uncharacterized protein YgbK (DUF1537 family)
MEALHVIADDLTGACDVGAALLPWPTPVVVWPDGDGADASEQDRRPLREPQLADEMFGL